MGTIVPLCMVIFQAVKKSWNWSLIDRATRNIVKDMNNKINKEVFNGVLKRVKTTLNGGPQKLKKCPPPPNKRRRKNDCSLPTIFFNPIIQFFIYPICKEKFTPSPKKSLTTQIKGLKVLD